MTGERRPDTPTTLSSAVEAIAARLSDCAETVELVTTLDDRDPVGTGADTTGTGTPRISVLPLATRPGSTVRTREDARLDVELDVLVTVTGPAIAALDTLHACLGALDGVPGLLPVADPVPASWWLAMRARPRPSLVVRTRVPVARALPDLPPAREHVLVHDHRRPAQLRAVDATGELVGPAPVDSG